jgi:hypothetical protein
MHSVILSHINLRKYHFGLQQAGGGCWQKHQFNVQQAIELGMCWTACLQATEPLILQFSIAVSKAAPHFQRDLRSEYIFGAVSNWQERPIHRWLDNTEMMGWYGFDWSVSG